MEQNNNRVMQGMQDWLQREKNMSELFSPNVIRSRYFQQVKLEYLRDMEKTIGPNATRDEKMTLKILRGERRDLERKLYPNLIVRTTVKVANAVKNLMTPRIHAPAYERTQWMLRGPNIVQETNDKKNMVVQGHSIKTDTRPVPRMMEKKPHIKAQGRKI